MLVDFATTDLDTIYRILIGSVAPRPIAWVSTVDKAGKPNLAPFSFFTVASANPPVLCFAPALKEVVVDGVETAVPKDTLRNITDTGEFVVNVVSKKLAEKMNQTSGEYAPGESEFTAAGLTALVSSKVKPPRVGESLVNFECALHQIVEFGDHPGAGRLVLGRILCVHLDQSVYQDERMDISVLDPIGRLNAHSYCTIKDQFVMKRPQV